MATYVPPKRATAFRFWVSLVSQADVKKLQSSPTLAAGDVKVSKDGGAQANLTTLPTVTPAAGVLVQVDLSATEMTADNVSVVFIDAAGAEWCDLMVNLQTSARQVDDLAFPNVSGRGMDVSAGGDVDAAVITIAAGAVDAAAIANAAIDAATFAAGAIDAAAIANGAIDAATFAAGAIDAAAIAADAGTEIAAAVWDRDATLSQTQGTFGQAIGDPVADANTIFKAVVTDATGATVGVDVVAVQADTDNIQTRLPAALVGGRIDSSVGAMAADVVTAAAIGSGAIDSDAFAVNAINSGTIATGAIDALEFGQAAADKVWASATRSLTDKDGFTLTAAERDNIIKAASGTTDSGTTTTIVDAERTEADTDYWSGSVVLVTSGPNVGQMRRISAFNAATDTITVAAAFTQAMAVGHTYLILRSSMAEAPGAGSTDWSAAERQQIRDALGVDGTKTAAIGGQLQVVKAKTDQLVFTIANKVDSSIQAAGDIVAAAANKVADHVLRRTTANIEASTDGDTLGARSLYGAIARLVHKWSISGTTRTITKADDVTALTTEALSSTPTADPVTGVDPT